MRALQKVELPLDLYSAIGSDWMNSAYWPVSYSEMRARLVKLLWSVESELDTADRELVDIVKLSAPMCVHWACSVVESALLAQKCMSGVASRGNAPLFDYIVGKVDDVDVSSLVRPKRERSMGALEAHARAIVRTASWSTGRTALKAIFAPSAIAIEHNSVLQEYALRSDFGIRFRRGDEILHQLGTVPVNRDLSDRASEWFVSRFMAGIDGLPDVFERTAALLRIGVRSVVARAVGDLAALKEMSLPSSVWSGTAGKWSSRAIGLSVLQKGGEVWRFDHGGGVGLVHDAKFFNLMELCVSSAYVANTKAAKTLYEEGLLGDKKVSCVIEAGQGDPTFRSADRKTGEFRSRPRVLYVTTIFKGERQFHPAFLPDPLYLFWQTQIASALEGWPLDLVLKPAPEGLLVGKPHPLSARFVTSDALFENEIDCADVVVFDYAHTTTFWKAMASGVSVVLLDLGNNAIGDDVRDMLVRSGCIILKAQYDEFGLPNLDFAELQEAVFRRSGTSPEAFRALCAG